MPADSADSLVAPSSDPQPVVVEDDEPIAPVEQQHNDTERGNRRAPGQSAEGSPPAYDPQLFNGMLEAMQTAFTRCAAASAPATAPQMGQQPREVPHVRKYTQLKDFRPGTLPMLDAPLLSDPEFWFLKIETLFKTQNIHPGEYVACLFNHCEPHFRDDIYSKISAQELQDYDSVRKFIAYSFGPK